MVMFIVTVELKSPAVGGFRERLETSELLASLINNSAGAGLIVGGAIGGIAGYLIDGNWARAGGGAAIGGVIGLLVGVFRALRVRQIADPEPDADELDRTILREPICSRFVRDRTAHRARSRQARVQAVG